MSSRDDIVRVAKSYIGTVGGSINHAEIISIFNSVKPFGYTAHKSDPWCSEFVSACAIQAFGKKTAKKYFPLSAACLYMINKAKEMNIWVESDKYVPAKGDFLIYSWSDNGKGECKKGNDHVGIVEYYKDGIIHMIEGNYSNRVKRRTVPVNGRYIRGFVTPDYESIRSKKITKSMNEVIKEVLSGKWGTGAERKRALTAAGYDYDEVQAEINRIIKLTDKTLAGKYGTGHDRKEALGADYDIVQWNINRICKEKENTK